MKNILFTRSPDIHPSYYEQAFGKDAVAPMQHTKTISVSLSQIVQIAELFALLAVSVFFLHGLQARSPQLVSSPEQQVHVQPTNDVDQKFERVGEILDFLLKSQIGTANVTASRPESSKTCRVAVSKAVLRAGPGKNFSPLMSLDQNTDLLVQSEAADWLQVVSPLGKPAWIARDLVQM